MSGLVADFTDANVTAAAEYFVRKFNLIASESEYQKEQFTLHNLPKDTEKFKKGDAFTETLVIADGWAGGPGWAKGNTYFFTSKKARWLVERPYAQYARMTFDNLLLARTPTGTLLDVQGKESDGVKANMLNTLEFEIWNDGSGNRGRIQTLGGSEATRVVVLYNFADTYNFQHNMVVYGRTQGDGAGTAHSDAYRITDINPNAGQLTMVQLTNTAGQELADEDYLYAYGSEANYMPGIPTFIPNADPADTLFGVTRTGDPATSGWRFTFKQSISYTIQYALTQMGKWLPMKRVGPKMVVVLGAFDWLMLSQEREGRVMEDPDSVQKWGLEGLKVRTPAGAVTCVTIPQLSDGRGYIIDWDSFCLYTLGNLPHVAMDDGKVFQRLGINDPAANAHPVTDGDGIEMRLRIWKLLLCRRPMSNATFPTVAS